MKRWAGGISLGLMLVTGASGAFFVWPSAGEAIIDTPSDELALEAVSEDRAIATRAIDELRRRGPEGHEALMRVHASGVSALRAGRTDFPEAARLRRAIDRVSAQRDGHASGLYWHTDLEAAKREARHSGRPILSLRLLGNLDEELSCANSRFFRTVLYSDPEVASRMREHFVLHWSSERPAPRITIDMGDGRRLVRTITGNSLHYVLDANGRPLDGIVGLYAPSAFLIELEEGERAFTTCGAVSGAQQIDCLAAHHTVASTAMRRRWEAMVARDASMVGYDAAVASLSGRTDVVEDEPPAFRAMEMTIGKAVIERPMLQVVGLGAPQPEATREPDFARAGLLLYGADPMSAEGVALLRVKVGEEHADRAQADLTRTALGDGARNELLFHRVIHEQFAARATETATFEAMNEWVYRALMLTPASDPWLGLMSDGQWDVIER
jgi:hypothetical protein